MDKVYTLDVNGVEIEFETLSEISNCLGLAQPNISKYLKDGKEHTTKIKFKVYYKEKKSSTEEKDEWKRDKQGRISYINENVERFFETDPRYAGKFAINGKKLTYDGRDIDHLTENCIIDDVSKFFVRRISRFDFLEGRIIGIVNKSTK